MTETNLPRILVVEDQLNWRRLYKIWLKSYCQLFFCSNRVEAEKYFNNNPVDVVIMDLGLPEPQNGIDTIKDILSEKRNCKIIVVSAFTDRKLHLQVQKLGVYAVFEKDERLESELPVIIRKAYEMISLERENIYLRKRFHKEVGRYKILGSSPAAKNLRRMLQGIVQTDAPLVITGPTGSGKTFFAKLIHFSSPRYGKPLVSINCANLPPSLVESELFGHLKGSYTGAQTTTMGKFRQANNGTILLDEIGELSTTVQAKLLKVIEEKSFYPLGGHSEIEVDVRVIASTNRNLKQEVKRGTFREDLYYRLGAFTIHIPELEKRKEDIPEYFDLFLNNVCEEEGLPIPKVEPPVYQALQECAWPGNLRELKNVITRLVLFHPKVITVDLLAQYTQPSLKLLLERAVEKQYSLKELSALYIQKLYQKLQNKKEIAKALGINQKTVHRYLEMKVDKDE